MPSEPLTLAPGIRGAADVRDDDALLALALLSLADVEEAAGFWRRSAPPVYKALADARIAAAPPADAPPTTPTAGKLITWVPAAMEFRTAGGVLDPLAIRSSVLYVVEKSQLEADREVAALIAGILLLGDWQEAQYASIKRIHLAAAIVGSGGSAQLSGNYLGRSAEVIPAAPEQAETLGDVVAFQFGRMQNFAQQIEARAQSSISPQQIEARTRLYRRSAYPTFQQARAFAARSAFAATIGLAQERNVLAPADHCQAKPGEAVPDCPSQTALGWVGLGSLTPVGQRKCRGNCLCHIEYRAND